MLRLTPFLLFHGNCKEAMTFYSACFGGELVLTALADTPMKAQFPEDVHHKIVNAHLKSDAVEFTGTDWLHTTHVPKQGNMSAMYVTSTHYDELKAIFDKLADGANKEFFVELQDMPFGIYGRFTDRYGIEWFFRGDKA